MNPAVELKDFEKESAQFDALMPCKVKDILVVSSLYDMYNLREDGQLASSLLSEYAELRLSGAPTIRRFDTGQDALEALRDSKFGLIIVFRSLIDMDPVAFRNQAKLLSPGIPVVLLAFHHKELKTVRDQGGDEAYDKTFFWNGESKIFLEFRSFLFSLPAPDLCRDSTANLGSDVGRHQFRQPLAQNACPAKNPAGRKLRRSTGII